MKTEEAKHRYFAAKIFGSIFILSVSLTIWGATRPAPSYAPCPPDEPRCGRPNDPSPLLIWVPLFTAVLSAIGTISTVMLAWRSDRRDAREQELKIKQLEIELEKAKQAATTSTPKKGNKGR